MCVFSPGESRGYFCGETLKESEKLKKVEEVILLMRKSANSSSSACKEAGIAHSTFNHWVEGFGMLEDYARARSDMHDRLADELIALSDEEVPTLQHGGMDNAAIQNKKLRIETRKWQLSKTSSKYADKVDLTSSDGSMTPKTIDASSLSDSALAELLKAKNASK